MEEFFMFALGLIAGVGLHRYLHERYRKEDTAAHDARHAAQLKALQDEVRQADAAHAETKQRLIALQLERGGGAAGNGAAATTPKVMPSPTPPRGAAPEAAAGSPDDLTRVKGIGKVMEKKLHELGITSLRQLAELQPPDIRRINAAIEFPGRAERERWVEQARSMIGR